MYYVYEWYIVSTGEIIYVGKGTRLRYKVKKHNRLFNEMIKRFDCASRIIKTFEDEKEAFQYEHERISELKLQDQCVCNIHKGGVGGTTLWWTEEMRKQYSEQNVMRSQKQRKRMSKANPMKDPTIAKSVGEQHSRPVIVGKKEYPSVKQACMELNVCSEVIKTWCLKGINPKGEQCRYKDSEQVIFKDKRYNKGGCKAIIYLGKRYESIKDCSEDIKTGQNTIIHWLKRGFDIQGNPCRYEGDEKEYQYDNPFKGKKSTPVIINEKHFSSVDEASQFFGVAKTTLYAYLQGRRKSNKYTCEYDNQKPSQGKSDNSTLEGSTTNG